MAEWVNVYGMQSATTLYPWFSWGHYLQKTKLTGVITRAVMVYISEQENYS